MTAQQPQRERCVLTRHDVQSIKDLIFIVGGNSESSAQKAIFEILANNMRRPHTPAPDNVWSADPKKGCEPCKNTECGYCAMRTENINEHDASVARTATLAAADDLINWIRICDEDSDHTRWSFKEIERVILAFKKEVLKERKP